MADLDKVLRAQELEIAKDREIERVLLCCSLDFFAVLQINPLHDPYSLYSRVKKTYRKKSLLIHPDRARHEKAPEAFDLVKKAEAVLSTIEEVDPSDDTKARLRARTSLIEVYQKVAEGLKITGDIENFEDARNVAIREKVKMVLEDQAKEEEVERGFQQRQDSKKREEITSALKERDLKKKWDTKWEEDRDARVDLWRSFTHKVEKKKKKSTKKKLLA